MEESKSLVDQFFELEAGQRRTVQLRLCEHALEVWNRFASGQGEMGYVESVVGTRTG